MEVSVHKNHVEHAAHLHLPSTLERNSFTVNSLNSEHTLGTQQTLPASTTEISVRDAQSLIAQARMEMATAPINDTEKTAHFIKRINQMHAMAEGLARGIEQFTYLKSVEHQVLRAVQKEVSHPRHIGRRVGMDTEATSIIVEKLESKGYVHVAERIGQRIIDVVITDAGTAALAQAEAVQFRSVDALLQQASDQDVQRLMELLDESSQLVTRLALSLASGTTHAFD